MSFSGMLFLMLLGLIIFGPKKLPQLGQQIGRVLTQLKSFSNDFRSQVEIEMQEASKGERIAQASLPQSESPTDVPKLLETAAFGSEPGRVEAFHG